MTTEKNQELLAFLAYHIGGGRYGVKNAAGERVGEFIGDKEEAQAEAERLIAALPPAAPAGDNTTSKGDGGSSDGQGNTGQELKNLPGQTAELVGVLSKDGSVLALADMPEAELRQLGLDMDIVDAGALPLDQLIAAIQAEKIEVAGLTASGQQSELGSGDHTNEHAVFGHQYLVNRERLEHDGETYTFGETVVIEDWAQAKLLLDRRAILMDVE